MTSDSSSGPQARGSRAPTRAGRIRRRLGFVLLGLCFVVPGWFIVSSPRVWNLKLNPWLSWTWELPGPLPWVVVLLYVGAACALLPEALHTLQWGRAHRILLVLAIGALFCLAGLMSAVVIHRPLMGGYRIVRLPDSGVYERAVLEAHGQAELGGDLWVLRRQSDEFELLYLGYQPCDWPIEVRESAHGPRYLIVDSRLRASELLDLSTDDPFVSELPEIEELRREFGEDITAIATWEE